MIESLDKDVEDMNKDLENLNSQIRKQRKHSFIIIMIGITSMIVQSYVYMKEEKPLDGFFYLMLVGYAFLLVAHLIVEIKSINMRMNFLKSIEKARSLIFILSSNLEIYNKTIELHKEVIQTLKKN